MKVAQLRVRNFRNHQDSCLQFGESINLLLGSNGQGKTNILEAVSYLGLTKSFFSVHDATVLQVGKDGFVVEGDIVEDSGAGRRIQISYNGVTREKEISINNVLLERLNLLVGQCPVVVLSPESAGITNGAPGERRRFLDLALAQQSRSYLEDLLEYRQVLRHRNRLLWMARGSRLPEESHLRPWTESLGILGGRIIRRRIDFVRAVSGAVSSTYRTLAENEENVDVRYVTVSAAAEHFPPEDIAGLLIEGMESRKAEEARRAMTLVGPHRDELALSINGLNVQQYASQGQHKTLLLAMKVAEFIQLKEMLGEVPVLLLDDLFGELDPHRAGRIIRLVDGLGQSIITATDGRAFEDVKGLNGDLTRYGVVDGTCTAC
jgi:DNA replication and repair protein RecF